jgi:hypothetical protein
MGSAVRERWRPTGGMGFNPTPHVGLDFAAFTTNANLARKDTLALAVSFRLNHIR